jgi:hypothetical protein
MWDNNYGRNFRRPDKQQMFVVRFADGSSAYTRIAPHIATFGVSPAVMRIVAERQSRGEIPAGNILEIVRAR